MPIYKSILKDNDFALLQSKTTKKIFNLSDHVSKLLIKNLDKDVEFLKSKGLLDYSFFVAVEYCEGMHTRIHTSRHSFFSENMHEVYHFGIIDYLQNWSCGKRFEHFCKPFVKRVQAEDLSSVPPELYGDRFLRSMTDALTPNKKLNLIE